MCVTRYTWMAAYQYAYGYRLRARSRGISVFQKTLGRFLHSIHVLHSNFFCMGPIFNFFYGRSCRRKIQWWIRSNLLEKEHTVNILSISPFCVSWIDPECGSSSEIPRNPARSSSASLKFLPHWWPHWFQLKTDNHQHKQHRSDCLERINKGHLCFV